MAYKDKETKRRRWNEWYAKNKDRISVTRNARNASRREAVNLNNRRYRIRLRREALDHYGGKCECCGEERYEFLCFDHVAGGGTKHRKEVGVSAGGWFVLWLRKNNYPSVCRILCHNCNVALGVYGYCPHKNPENSP